MGDEALTLVASVLLDSTRQVDRVARYGGEEFVVLLPNTDLEGGVQAAERIRAKLAKKTIDVGKVKASVTVSTGVAELPAHGEDPGELMAAADAALYRAKRSGRDRIVSAVTPEKAGTPRKTGAARRAKASSPKKAGATNSKKVKASTPKKAKASTPKKASARKKVGTPK